MRYRPTSNRVTVIPDWGGGDLKLGTVRAAVRQLDHSWDEFKGA